MTDSSKTYLRAEAIHKNGSKALLRLMSLWEVILSFTVTRYKTITLF